MSRSFHIDLRQYTLGRPIGIDENVVERKLDVLDVVSVLMDEGFTNFNEPRSYVRMYGNDYENLREQILSQLTGIPRDAYIGINAHGKERTHLVITLNY